MSKSCKINSYIIPKRILKKLAQKYIELMRKEKLSLTTVLEREENFLDIEKDDIKIYIHTEAKKELLPQLIEHSLEIFLTYRKTGKWGPAKEHQLSCGFVRHIQKIPPSQNVDWSNIISLNRMIDKLDKKLGYKTPEQLIKYCKNDRPIKLFGENYDFFSKLAEFVNNLDAPFRFYNSSGPFCGEFIFGEVEYEPLGEITIYRFVKEWSRSPMHHLGIVARAPNSRSKKPMMQLRPEPILLIINNKWLSFDFEDESYINNLHEAISFGFKKNALEFCGINSEDLKKMTPETLADKMFIYPIIYAHECAHFLNQKFRDAIDDVYDVIYDVFSFEENVLIVLEELCASWASKDQMKGEILKLVEHSVIDNARGLLFMYMSDCWFFEESAFQLRKQTSCGLVLTFVNDDRTFDYDLIIKEQPVIYNFLKEKQHFILRSIRKLIYSHIYKDGKTYGDIKCDVIKILKEDDDFKGKTEDEIIKSFKFWNMIKNDYVKTDSVLEKKIDDLLSLWYEKIEHVVFNLIKEILERRNEMEKKNYKSLWDFIVNRCKEIGLYEEPKESIASEEDYEIEINEYFFTKGMNINQL